jgi:hypothetical protein
MLDCILLHIFIYELRFLFKIKVKFIYEGSFNFTMIKKYIEEIRPIVHVVSILCFDIVYQRQIFHVHIICLHQFMIQREY